MRVAIEGCVGQADLFHISIYSNDWGLRATARFTQYMRPSRSHVRCITGKELIF